MEPLLLAPTRRGPLERASRIVRAPMTRGRAIGNVPNALMAAHDAQRAGFGLLITGGTAPSANGPGHARIPGAFSPEAVTGWRRVADAVHGRGGGCHRARGEPEPAEPAPTVGTRRCHA